MEIRTETAQDQDAVRAIHTAAFETPAEAGLVDKLRQQARPLLSLVAEIDGEVAGHILFSPVTLSSDPELPMMGLAPMAVAPERQRSGIGSALVRAGLDRLREQPCAAVVVLGHPEYYPRLGFVPSTRFGINSEYDVPEEIFMAQELRSGALDGKAGRVSYHPAFAGV